MLQSPFQLFLDLDANIASNWDLYLITIITLMIGFLFYLRRPPAPAAELPVQRVAPAAPPQPAAAPEQAALLDDLQ